MTDVQAWKKLLLGVSIASFLTGVYATNWANVNGRVGDYFRNIAYKEHEPLPSEEMGFSTGNVLLFDGYNHNKRIVGELAYGEAADVLLERHSPRHWWYYAVSEGGVEGWIAPNSRDFRFMDENYLDDAGAEKSSRSSYFELLIKLGRVDEKFLADIVQGDYHYATRDAALQALSEMNISSETQREILELGKRLSKNYTCFVFSSGGKDVFDILSRSGNEEAFQFMTNAFLRELSYLDNCRYYLNDGPANILKDAAKTPEQVEYLRHKLRDEIRRYEIDYDHFIKKGNFQEQSITKFKKNLLNETMP